MALIHFVATRCDPDDLPTFADTALVINGHFYNDTATYSCQLGYQFATDVYSVTVMCELSEKWDLEVVPATGCVRKCG